MANEGLLGKDQYFDNHFHLNRNGRFLDAAKDFKMLAEQVVLVYCLDFFLHHQQLGQSS